MDKIAEQVKAVQGAFNAVDPVPGPFQPPSAYSAFSAVGACPLVLGPVVLWSCGPPLCPYSCSLLWLLLLSGKFQISLARITSLGE